MRVLGLYAGHDSSACVVEDGEVLIAIEEERLTGIKKQSGFPARSIMYICKYLNCSPWDFDKVMVATPSLHWGRPHAVDIYKYLELYPDATLVPHHQAHATLAYCWSGWDDCTVMTADGGGDEYFATVNYCKNGKITRFTNCRKDANEAIGMLYYYITEALGFIPNRHEGKVMGLAARGKNRGIFNSLFWVDGSVIKAEGKREDFIVFRRLQKEAVGMPITDIAASCQNHFEEIIINWVVNCVNPSEKLAVAGGCFANVLCNMKLSQLVDSFYVVPPMLDDGLSIGAALSAFNPLPVKRQEHLYLGVSNVPREIYKYTPSQIAQMVHEGKIVGLCQGKMEFGPRALGNRTILANATDAKINDYLNYRLGRNEFMPFAPVILDEFADEILQDYNRGIDNAPFMTNCWYVRDEWRNKIPAVVHIDGTVRPQVIKREINPFYYDIVYEYCKLTGIPVLINTSFNAHEDPIVAWQSEAEWALKTGRIDILVEN